MCLLEKGSNEEFWKGFQAHVGYSDEELAAARNHPKKKSIPVMAGAIQNKTLIIEVVESHGCANGMKVGDRLYFTECGRLDPKRSSPWCSHALESIPGMVNMFHTLLIKGLDPNDMYYDHYSCIDAGSKYGWGQVIMKAYVIDEK